MALLLEQLTVWEIGFRWAGYDPDKFYFRLPLAVRDNLRLIVDQIYAGHLHCETLSLRKYQGNNEFEAMHYIKYWLASVDDCVEGVKYSKDLFKFAIIDRNEFQVWCSRHKIPLPEFWFPSGWGVNYEWPDDTPEDQRIVQVGETTQQSKVRLDDRHRIEMACKQIALVLWERDLTKNIKDIANSNEVQILGGGKNFEFETVLEWLGKVDPRDPAKKRGPKRKIIPE